MGKTYFTSDNHFGHERVIQFDKRPFVSVEEMDAEMIRRWNAKVGKGDLVYVLGDMIWKTRNDDAPSPVSYTHLDVYKRQILGKRGKTI